MIVIVCKSNVQHVYLEQSANDQPTVVPSQTNALYYAAFEEWATQFTNVKIVSDQTTTNEVKSNSNENQHTLTEIFPNSRPLFGL